MTGKLSQMAVAVLLPCHNEEAAIGQTVRSFKIALPHAAIYVYDNNSTDGTSDVAAAAGAFVRHEPQAGQRQCGSAHVRRCRRRLLYTG